MCFEQNVQCTKLEFVIESERQDREMESRQNEGELELNKQWNLI